MKNYKILLSVILIGLVLMSFTNINMHEKYKPENLNLLNNKKLESTYDISGKWINLKGCPNANGERAYFQFNSDGTGKIYNVDCRNTCEGYGYYLNFNWKATESSVTLNYTSVSKYCNVQPPTPKPEDKEFTITGNELSLGGAVWTKK